MNAHSSSNQRTHAASRVQPGPPDQKEIGNQRSDINFPNGYGGNRAQQPGPVLAYEPRVLLQKDEGTGNTIWPLDIKEEGR
jgi:hypothetical protein